MPRETRQQKALRIIGEGRVKLTAHTRSHYTFAVIGDTNPFAPYTVELLYDGNLLVESCTCEGGQHHPVRGKCSHVEACRLIAAVLGGPRKE